MCLFCVENVIFLGFVVSSNNIEADEEKVESIKSLSTLTNAIEVRSFHDLASFY